MSHASVPAELRDRLAPPADLVRLSVGIEDPEDLLDDLRQALAVAGSIGSTGSRSSPALPTGMTSEVFAEPVSCTPD